MRGTVRRVNGKKVTGFGFVLGLPAQKVSGLAPERHAQCGERRETHRLGATVLEHRQVGGRDPNAFRELTHGHLALGQHHVDVDDDRHQITSSSSACRWCASASRATAWVSSIRITRTTSAIPATTTAAPPIRRTMPGGTASPGASVTPSASMRREPAAAAPMMTSTYRKAARENTVPRRTIVSRRQTQTAVTWMITKPRTVITMIGARTSATSELKSSFRSVANRGTITACTNSEPASTIASTMRSARTVSFPIGPPAIELRQEYIDKRYQREGVGRRAPRGRQ